MILFEDEHLLAVNKPAGWNTHSPSPFASEGVYEWLKNREPRFSTLAIIHRLDKETSGVLVFGKTAAANKALTAQFTNRQVAKKYLLWTDRPVKRGSFAVSSSLARAGERYASCRGSSGEPAETRFSVVRQEGNRTLVAAEPLTGRTHQIRVHASENGFPVLGDTLYGGTPADRVHLHAASIRIEHPATKQTLTCEAPCAWEAAVRGDGDGMRLDRAAFIDGSMTDSFRVMHGAADGHPGLYVDKLGSHLLVQTASPLQESDRELIGRLTVRFGARGVYHKLLTRQVRGASVEMMSPRLIEGTPAPESFSIRENGLNFEIRFSEGYSVGLFLDQRDNRRRLLTGYVGAPFGNLLARQPGAGRPELLNVFAYTCGFSVAAARAGMRTTSLDLSKKYLEWGRRNFSLNGLAPAEHDFIYGDAFDWIRRLGRKGRAYDVIVLDPPTFSQSKESGMWQAAKDYHKLVEAVLPLLRGGGVLFASTNAARLEAETFIEAIRGAGMRAGRAALALQYLPQPPDFPITREESAYLKTVWVRIPK